MRRNLLAAAALLAVACTTKTWPNVTTTPSGPALSLAPRPADCEIEFYRTRPPDRPYDEVAALHFEGGLADTPATAQEAVRREACALGADAVLVTHELVPPSLGMAATALSYRDAREKHRADAAQRQAAAEAEARAAGARAAAASTAAGASAAAARTVEEKEARKAERARAAGYVEAVTTEIVVVHATVGREGHVMGTVPKGTRVWVSAKPSSGWRRIMLDDGKGWIEEGSFALR